jgi:hypothetical protein
MDRCTPASASFCPFAGTNYEIVFRLTGLAYSTIDRIGVATATKQSALVSPGCTITTCLWRIVTREPILPVSRCESELSLTFGTQPGGSDGAAKHAAMEKHRMISWKFCRG